MSLYCDVSLPVPMEAPYTYSLPETLWHRVQRGCRVSVGFGTRQLTGVVLSIHDQQPNASVKPVLRLLDEVPVLDAALIGLGQWIARYYCCPLGEVLRAMTFASSTPKATINSPSAERAC